MQTNKNKRIGVLIMLLGLASCSFFLWYFQLDGQKVDYSNLSVVFRFLLASAFLPLGLYFGLYFYSGKKLANQIGGGLALLLILAFLLGYLRTVAF